ncbi:MAG: UDP-N-acetylmuramate dehydrogenase [Negativicutes bacterium]|nr:UDP-N-acetylmuramate dehydrogenase [Negativicutes bacterium]
MKDHFADIQESMPEIRLLQNASMASFTSFQFGGPADLLAEPSTATEIVRLVQYANRNELPYLVIGKGSNLIVRDGGIRGLVIVLADRYSRMELLTKTTIRAEAGARLIALARFAYEQGLSGLEFACGIPGSLGGAVAMDAGAYGGEMKQVVLQVTALNRMGQIIRLSNQEMNFSYRHSTALEQQLIVLSAELELTAKDPVEIKAQMDDLSAKRRSKQPLQYPSAGSVFKRPPGNFAGTLIEQAGLKGYRIGDAQVSELHAGFIINLGHATASDVLQLIQYIQSTVLRQSGIRLEPEIQIIGEEI